MFLLAILGMYSMLFALLKTSVSVCYRRIKDWNKFGCVWIKPRVC